MGSNQVLRTVKRDDPKSNYPQRDLRPVPRRMNYISCQSQTFQVRGLKSFDIPEE
jgi:hypothetical protein